jgi:hypothetical protein
MHLDDLESKPKYTALSYAWGSPERSRPIIVNGHSLRVTRSIEIACGTFDKKKNLSPFGRTNCA